MDTIEFVVRERDGDIRRGVFADSNGTATLNMGAGEDISINLRRYQAAGYAREGGTLVITLADGRTLRLNNFFENDNELYLSADGLLTEVALSEHAGGLDAIYQEAVAFGKWTPDDALFFTGGPNDGTIVAEAAAANEVPTLAAAPILAGLGGLGGGGLAAAGAGLVGVGLIGGGGGDGGGSPAPDTTPPTVDLDDGVITVDHIFNDEDHSDGVEIGGTGEPGVTVIVEIDGDTEETVVADDGTWEVVFDPEVVEGGEYVEEITVTAIDDAGNETVITDSIQVDTITTVTLAEIDGAVASENKVINAEGHADGVTMSGVGEAGASITVEIEGGASATTTVAEDGTWSVNFAVGDVEPGEYSTTVTVTAIDAVGNSATATQTMIVDTVTNVSIVSNSSGVDGIVNAAENGAATTFNGTAQAGASVVVTLTGESGQVLGTQTVTAGGDGAWSASFAAGTLPGGEYDATVTAVATDAAGNTATDSATLPVDTITEVELNMVDGISVSVDNVINGAERADGVAMSGTGEPGGSIVVQVAGGGSATTTVGADGTWTVNFAAGDIPAGETTVPVTVSITDAVGNTASDTQQMVIDTFTEVAITSNNAGPDNIYNDVETGAPTILQGTGQPGSSVVVTLTSDAGAVLATKTVTVNGSGSWAATFASGSLPGGEYGVNVSADATDAAGNTASATSSFQVDTVANVAVNVGAIESNNVINIVEAQDGVTLTGTTDANGIVTVNFGGTVRQVQANAAGQWSADYPASAIPMGVETTMPITATFTDAAGNTASATGSVDIDTIVRNLSVGEATGDGIIDAVEAQGFTLTGTTEQGAQSVTVQLGDGTVRNAVVDAAGNWSLTYGPGDIPAGEYDTTITVTTIDKNGNEDSVTTPVTVDTEVPEAPLVVRYTEYTRGDSTGVSAIGTELTNDEVTISQLTETGQVQEVSSDISTISGIPGVRPAATQFEFNELIPDGSHLIINAEDGVGNNSATFVALDETGTNTVTVNPNVLSDFNIGAIDLSIAHESNLTLTEADIVAMSDTTDALIVHGGADDILNIAGATSTGQSEVIGDRLYTVYSLGDASIIVDNEVSVNPIV